jgi:hypothetical protein
MKKKVIEGWVEKGSSMDDVLKYVHYDFCNGNCIHNDTTIYEKIDFNTILEYKKIQIIIREITDDK